MRYDKTNDLRSGGTNYGNAYHVANSNWYNIHHPITEHMITTGRNIGEIDEDVYYNKTSRETSTRALRNFHNVYVKKKLIMGVSDRGNTLIDYAVGKGGDFSKWIDAKLDFVFGIDVSKDNIENQVDGACARYLNFRQKYNKMPVLSLFMEPAIPIYEMERHFSAKRTNKSPMLYLAMVPKTRKSWAMVYISNMVSEKRGSISVPVNLPCITIW